MFFVYGIALENSLNICRVYETMLVNLLSMFFAYGIALENSLNISRVYETVLVNLLGMFIVYGIALETSVLEFQENMYSYRIHLIHSQML